MRYENTISHEVTLSGFGYWSGQDIQVTFRPAAVGTGIHFERTDIPGCPRIFAGIDRRSASQRRTNLIEGSVHVEMVEHVMAALAGLKIDNCIVAVDQPEMPGFDGSAARFVAALHCAGIVRQSAVRSTIVVNKRIRIDEGDAWIEISPCAGRPRELTYVLDYSHIPVIGQQIYVADLDTVHFEREIAPARTFVTRDEARWFRDQGRGDRVFYSDLLVFDETGPIDNILRFENECARHKLLDLIGDFALLGCDLLGRITACRSGHRLNGDMVQLLLEQFQIEPSTSLRAA